jgi:hypothetical protein
MMQSLCHPEIGFFLKSLENGLLPRDEHGPGEIARAADMPGMTGRGKTM